MDERAPVTLGVSLKLYLDVSQTTRWARAVATLAAGHPAVRDGSVRLLVLPSLPALGAVRDAFAGTPVRLGAQDLFWEDRGAYTGAVSGADLRQAGCEYVEIGHAERRAVFHEGDDVIGKKLRAAVRNRLTPILCVGEHTRAPAEPTAQECVRQLDIALQHLDGDRHDLIVAYEPVWAIGAPQPAPAAAVIAVCAALRDRVRADERLGETAVIYGGSAQPGSLTALGRGVDGLFLGRFAHDPDRLARMIDEAASLH